MVSKDDTGEVAGKIWNHLNDNGEVTVATIVRETNLTRSDVDQGIGWLAREGKVEVVVKGNSQSVSLRV